MTTEKSIKLECTPEQKIELLLNAINGLLGLTPKELIVVSLFLKLNPEYPCTSQDRKKVFEMMKLKSVQSLNNMIKSIVSKKVFVRTDRGYVYPAILQNIDQTTKISVHVQTI